MSFWGGVPPRWAGAHDRYTEEMEAEQAQRKLEELIDERVKLAIEEFRREVGL